MRIKKLLIGFSVSLVSISLFASCTSNPPTPVQSNTNTNTQNTKPNVATSHGGQQGDTTTPPATQSKGGPMSGGGTPIDTSKFDSDIKQAEEKYNKAKENNDAKMTLAKAYLARANALTEARQYRSALGDYRRTLKYDPNNEEAKDWVNQIVAIFEQMGRDVPKEGEEPPPLPYNKGN